MTSHPFAVFFYLGLMLIFLPFMRERTIFIPLAALAAYGLKRFADFAGTNDAIGAVQSSVQRFTRARQTPILFGLIAVAAIVPFVGSNYTVDVLTTAILYAILASALNITVGLTGVLVLGFIGFYAVGAYTTGLLVVKYELVGFWVALPISGCVALIFGLLLGMPTLRLKGDYLAIVTLGFGEIIKIFLNNLDSVTGGPNGILNIPRPSIGAFAFTGTKSFYYLTLAVLVIVIFILGRIIRSRFGRAWIAVRENDTAAAALGIDVFKKYLLSFSISAFFGGIAGSLFAAKQGFISPDSFSFMESVMVVCMVVLGGIGNLVGGVAGALLLVAGPELLRDFSGFRMLIFGALLIAFMIFRPQGLFGSPAITMEMEDAKEEAERL